MLIGSGGAENIVGHLQSMKEANYVQNLEMALHIYLDIEKKTKKEPNLYFISGPIPGMDLTDINWVIVGGESGL